MAATGELLDAGTVVTYLASRGLLDFSRGHAVELDGGVSNIVLAVSDDAHDVVVKQALPQLRVAEQWNADPDRVLAEADALEFVHGLTPELVPCVLDRDPRAHTLVLQRAPSAWADWKTRLLSGDIHAWVAGRLGDALATWHTATALTRELPARLDGTAGFEQLRLDPYYCAVGRSEPKLMATMTEMVEQLRSRRLCLVHGDFSPKNVLVGPSDQLWVIDFEVAHRGDPAFDLAFLLTHLTLKAVHRPEWSADYDRCADTFVRHYADAVDESIAPEWSYVFRHVASLLLARVRGKSPAEYLTARQRDQTWQLGLSLLAARPREVAELFRLRELAVGPR